LGLLGSAGWFEFNCDEFDELEFCDAPAVCDEPKPCDAPCDAFRPLPVLLPGSGAAG